MANIFFGFLAQCGNEVTRLKTSPLFYLSPTAPIFGGQLGIVEGGKLDELNLAIGQIMLHFAGASQAKGSGGYDRVLGQERPGPHDRIFADLNSVHDDGAHADEYSVGERAAVKDHPVADRDVVSHRGRPAPRIDVDHGKILDVRAR